MAVLCAAEEWASTWPTASLTGGIPGTPLRDPGDRWQQADAAEVLPTMWASAIMDGVESGAVRTLLALDIATWLLVLAMSIGQTLKRGTWWTRSSFVAVGLAVFLLARLPG